MNVFVTGATGTVGARLVRKLRGRGDRVAVLSRRADAWTVCGSDCTYFQGDPTHPGPWQDAVASCDGVVHLAGENVVARRWRPAFKQRLLDSRVKSTQQVVAALSRTPVRADGRPKVLVSASAVGYYGPHGDDELTEDSPPGSDFLAEVCRAWEAAAGEAAAAGVRVVTVRVGVVLDADSGALPRLAFPFKLYAGGPVGSGRQWMSWVHGDDLCELILYALDNPQAAGPVNGTAPFPVRNRRFAQALGRALRRPNWLPVPKLALRVLIGPGSYVVASGQRVLPVRAEGWGFRFRFPELAPALADLYPPPAEA